MKSDKNWDWKSSLPLIFCTLIAAIGFIIAALIFANVIADRPLIGNFSGSISNGYIYPELMGIDDLKQYMGLFPAYDESDSESYGNNYNIMNSELRSDLQSSILNGDWPGFPYVQLNDRLYFSKQAVDDWFAEQSKQQLHIK